MSEILLTINMIVQNNEDTIRTTLDNIKDVADEIVIVDGGSSDDTLTICNEYTDKLFFRDFDGDFSAQKNYANTVSSGRWIFNIDSDEIMADLLKKNLKNIIEENEKNANIDLIWIPRVNIVNNITKSHLLNWNWYQDEDGHINWPDYQGRLFRKLPGLHWTGRVHETIMGFRHYGRLPADKSLGLYLLHIKDIKKQEQQNNVYSTYV